MLPILLAVLLQGTVLALDLVPPLNTWVRDGQTNVSLLCKASDKIRSCSWSTPYGKTYPLESGLMAEGGRLLHFTEEESLGDKECGVTITSLEPRDQGRWKCNVGVVENSEVTTASGVANITIAVAPKTLVLSPDMFEGETVNLTSGVEYEVSCEARETKPAPTFTWDIEGEEVQGKTMDQEVMLDIEGLSTFNQKLFLTPSLDQANKTLRCTINHPGLVRPQTVLTTLVVTGEDPHMVTASMDVGSIVGVVVAVVLVLVTAGVLAVIYKAKYSKATDEDVEGEKGDAEKTEKDVEQDKNSQTESEAHEAANEEERKEKKKGLLQEKITTFFASLKPKEKRLDETVTTEWEKVDLDETKKGEEDKNTDQTDNDEEGEKKDPEKEENTKIEKPVKISSKVSSFFASFKKSENKTQKQEIAESEEEKERLTDEEEKKPEDDKTEVKEEETVKRLGSETPV